MWRVYFIGRGTDSPSPDQEWPLKEQAQQAIKDCWPQWESQLEVREYKPPEPVETLDLEE